MKTKLTIILLALCVSVQAANVQLNGIVTFLEGQNPPAQIGDVFTASLRYNPNTRLVNNATIIVGGQKYRYQADGTTQFTEDIRPCEGVFAYGVGSSPYLRLVLFADTPDCVIPKLPGFRINEFTFRVDGAAIWGVLTEIPAVRP